MVFDVSYLGRCIGSKLSETICKTELLRRIASIDRPGKGSVQMRGRKVMLRLITSLRHKNGVAIGFTSCASEAKSQLVVI